VADVHIHIRYYITPSLNKLFIYISDTFVQSRINLHSLRSYHWFCYHQLRSIEVITGKRMKHWNVQCLQAIWAAMACTVLLYASGAVESHLISLADQIFWLRFGC